MKRLLFTILSVLFVHLGFSQGYEIEEMTLEATIHEIEGVNLKSDEFSPFVIGDKIYFTSSRQYNKNAVGEGNWNKNGFLNVFEGSILEKEDGDIKIKDIRLMSNKVKSQSHTGPVCFTSSGDTLFYTQVVKVPKSGQSGTPQLFMAVKSNGKWKKFKRLPFCNPAYTFGHPSYDAKENKLYFASNRPGGKGLRDIYYVSIVKGKWSEPTAVPGINTANDEKFPFAIGGNVFFSSDREKGNGDMDIFYSTPSTADYPIRLEGVNSEFDDFGVFLLPDLSAGYLSSNRDGSDDLYYFTIKSKLIVKNQLAGQFKFESLDANENDLSVQLLDEQGEFMYEEEINNNGEFMFENIVLDSNFSVRLKGIKSTENMMLEFFNEEGNAMANFLLDEEGSFRYKKLFYQYGGVINFIPDNMIDEVNERAILSGKLVYEDEPSKVLKDAKVNLVNDQDDIVLSTKSDKQGNFEFPDLDTKENYYLQIPQCSKELVLYIYESEDIIYTQLKCNVEDYFMYRKLKPIDNYKLAYLNETEERDFLLGSKEIAGRFEPIDKSKGPIQCEVKVYDKDGILLGITQTDETGNFRFSDLTSEETTYQFSAGSNEQLQLTLYNRYGEAIAIMQEEENHMFIFRPLGFKNDDDLSLIDDGIEFNLNMSEKYEAVVVYFLSNQERVKSQDMAKLNKVYKLLKNYEELKLSVSAYADATASNEYNFILSQKRAEWIVDYLTSKGISNNRFTTNAYGETRLVDPDNNAINRRAELRIYQ